MEHLAQQKQKQTENDGIDESLQEKLVRASDRLYRLEQLGTNRDSTRTKQAL